MISWFKWSLFLGEAQIAVEAGIGAAESRLAWENSRHLATQPLLSPRIWRLRNEDRNSTVMTRHYPDLGCAFKRLKQNFHAASTTQIWVLNLVYYVFVPQTSQAKSRIYNHQCFWWRPPSLRPSEWNVSFPIARPTHFFRKVKKKKIQDSLVKEASTLIYKHTILF